MNKEAPVWILWLDCVGGLSVGMLALLFHPLLSELQGLPKSVVRFMAIANLIYGSYSLFVTTRNPRPIRFVKILSFVNMAWLFACLAIVIIWSGVVSALGVFMVLGEGAYVAGLGWTEWKRRSDLSNRAGA